MLDWILSVVSHPLAPWLSAGLILLWGLASWFNFRSKIMPVQLAVRDASQLVEGCFDARNFTESFREIEGEILSINELKRPWERFCQTLIHPVDGNILAIHTPELFFNLDTVIPPEVDLRHYRLVPSYLIGVGLVVTFSGFFAAFYFIYQGFSTQDAGTVNAALQGLLSTATVKFSASIAGLFAGLFFSWQEKRRLFMLTNQVDNFCTQLSDRIVWVTEDQLQQRQEREERNRHEAAEQLRRQFVTLADELVGKVNSELDRSVHGFVTANEQSTAQLQGLIQESEQRIRTQGLEPVAEAVKAEVSQVLSLLESDRFLVPVLERIRSESSQRAADSETLMRTLFTEMGEKLNQPAFVEPMMARLSEEVARIVELLRADRFFEPVTDFLEQSQSQHFTHFKQLFLQRMDEISQGVARQGVLDPIVAVVKQEVKRLADGLEAHRHLEPIMAGVRSEVAGLAVEQRLLLENLFQQQSRLLSAEESQGRNPPQSPVGGEGGDGQQTAVATADERSGIARDLGREIGPLLQELKGESARLNQGQLEMVAALSRQSETLSSQLTEIVSTAIDGLQAFLQQADPTKALLSAMAAEGRRLSELLLQKPELEPAVEMVKQETQRFSDQLQDSKWLEPSLAALQEEIAKLSDQLRQQLVFEPVMDLIRESSTHSIETQRQQLQDTFLEVGRQQVGQQTDLSPVLEAIKGEGERVAGLISDTQEMAGRLNREQSEAISQVASRLVGEISMEPVLAVVKAEGERVAGLISDIQEVAGRLNQEQNEAISQAASRLVGEVSMEPVLAAVKAEGERTAGLISGIQEAATQLNQEQGETLIQLTSKLQEAFSIEPILAVLKGDAERLSESLFEIKQMVEQEGQQFAEGRDLAVIEAISQVGDQIHNALSVDRLLDQIKWEGDRSSAKIEELVDLVLSQAAQSEAVDESLKTILGSLQMRLDDRPLLASLQETLEGALSGLSDRPQQPYSLDPVVQVLQSESERLSEQQQAQLKDGLAAISSQIDQAMGQEVQHLQVVTDQLGHSTRNLDDIAERLDATTVEAVVSAIQEIFDRQSEKDKETIRQSLAPEPSKETVLTDIFQGLARKSEESAQEADSLESLPESERNSSIVDDLDIEMVDVNLASLSGRNRERYFFGLLSNIASQLQDRTGIETAALKETINQLIVDIRTGRAISDLPIVKGLVKLGVQIDKVNLSVLEASALKGLDDEFLGLANFLHGYLEDPAPAVTTKSLTPAELLPTLDPTPEQMSEKMEQLMRSFEHQKKSKIVQNKIAESIIAARTTSDSREVASEMKKLLDSMDQKSKTVRKALPGRSDVTDDTALLASEQPLSDLDMGSLLKHYKKEVLR
ncbi:MAG: hypothetical protein HQL67_08070 [Magnetococcales bacterium]|nr:hypothetical protein [Magnetococcales bacterium]